MTKKNITARALIAALAIGAAACTDKASAPAPANAPADGDAAAVTSINIRYIDYDSLLSQYTLAQEIAASSQKLMVQYQQQERQKQQEIQTLGAEIQRKQENNIYLSQQSFESDVNNFNKKQNEAARYQHPAAPPHRLHQQLHRAVQRFPRLRRYPLPRKRRIL